MYWSASEFLSKKAQEIKLRSASDSKSGIEQAKVLGYLGAHIASQTSKLINRVCCNLC